MFQKTLAMKMFMRKEMQTTTCLLDIKDAQHAVWRVKLNVNRNYLQKNLHRAPLSKSKYTLVVISLSFTK